MSAGLREKLPPRDKYTVRTLLDDTKRIDPTPRSVYLIGNEVVYYEWNSCNSELGSDNPVTVGLKTVLEFMESKYETMLIEGEIWRTRDTPNAVINQLVKSLPPEVMEYTLSRPGEHIYRVLEAAREERLREIEEYRQMEEGIRKEAEASPDDPDVQNKLRLLLWILGHHKESSEAFQNARRLGWSSTSSSLVAL